MRINRFSIKNFRGIQHATVGLSNHIPGQVVTLVGLNESGKTTILEALSTFISADAQTVELIETVYSKAEAASFIPRDKRGRFTDRISVKATISLDASDIEEVRKALRAKGAVLDVSRFPKSISVEKAIIFKDSKVVDNKQFWTLGFIYKKLNGTKLHSDKGSGDPLWQLVVATLKSYLPEIIYFPTFLFAMPKRIILTELVGESVANSYYRNLLSFVMKAVDPHYSIEKHILKRVEELVREHGIASISDADLTGDIDSVIGDLSTEMSRVIVGAWKEILGKPLPEMRVGMRWAVDTANNNAVYVEIFVSEGNYTYSLDERSLGFRWFFSFLLFTQFRRQNEGKRPTIFLFDEPASHLHASAQAELLNSFGKIMDGSDFIIYSTHSHYMINPIWLEKACIVENQAVGPSADYEPYTKRPNDVVAVPYGQFVSKNPSRVSYFQPALDALRYRGSAMEFGAPALIVEGKFDYYPFRYLASRTDPDMKARCFPANGAGDMAALISLFRGWSLPFVIILDADKQGKLELVRYKKDYVLGDRQIMTLADADPGLEGKAFESIFGSDVPKLLEAHSLSNNGKLKAEGSALFQLLLASRDVSAKLDDTLASFEVVYKEAMSRLNSQIDEKPVVG